MGNVRVRLLEVLEQGTKRKALALNKTTYKKLPENEKSNK